MKAIKLIAVIIFALGMTAKAQTGLESGTQYGFGEDSSKCLMSYSLFSEYAKQKNYADAMSPWTYCFENAPAAGKGIYIYGVSIVKWEIKNAKTKEEKNEKIEKLMRVYDQRIKYFGDDRSYPEARLLGLKAIDYMTLKRSDLGAQKQSYEWLKQSIEELGPNVTPKILNYYMVLSLRFYSQDEITGEKMITDYETVQDRLEKIVARGGKRGEQASGMINSFEQSFANSGAADCNTLEQMYAPRLEANPTDEVLLAKLLDLFDKTECTDSELYYKASESMHKVNPTAASASGVAKMYLAQDNAAKAVLYYKEAVSLEVDDVRKAQYLYTIAYISFSKDKNLVEARKFALQAVGANPQWGEPYILIGKMYAQSAQSQKIGTKDIENQAGYWAAVDLFHKAKRVDAECASEADQNIKIYRNYFPTKEEIFFDPDYEAGKSVKVGGWIGTSTIVRSRD